MGKRDQQQTSVATDPRGDTRDLALDATGIGEVISLIDKAGSSRQLGQLAARMVELGNVMGDGDHGQTFAGAMRRLRGRLDADPTARHVFATHDRTFGRPARHLVTSADDWVVPMVEAVVASLPPKDRDRLCQAVITRVGRQHGVHPDFRPLLLALAREDQALDHLANAERGMPVAVAAAFVDVVMADADDGTELEAASWAYAQRTIAHQARNGGRMEQAVTRAAALLARIDNGREQMAQHSLAHRHAGLATRTAVAEFAVAELILLTSRPDSAVGDSELDIRAFVLREPAGRATVDMPPSIFETWARGRAGPHLLLDLVTIAILANHERHGLPPLPPANARDRAETALDHLWTAERHPSARMAIRAIDSVWPSGSWAGAA